MHSVPHNSLLQKDFSSTDQSGLDDLANPLETWVPSVTFTQDVHHRLVALGHIQPRPWPPWAAHWRERQAIGIETIDLLLNLHANTGRLHQQRSPSGKPCIPLAKVTSTCDLEALTTC